MWQRLGTVVAIVWLVAVGAEAQVPGRITGTVLMTGTGLPVPSTDSATVTIYNEATNTVMYVPATPTYVADLPPGRYYLTASTLRSTIPTSGTPAVLPRVYGSTSCVGPCVVARGTLVTVTAGGTTPGIDFAMEPGGSIAGTLRSTDGKPIRFVSVCAWTAVAIAMCGSTDSSGLYTIEHLPRGAYRIRAQSDGFRTEWFDDACDLCVADARTVAVTETSVATGIDFTLTPDGAADLGAIEGTVRIEPPNPFLDVRVKLHDASGRVIVAFPTISSSEISGSYGYRFGSLAPGTYYVRAASIGQLQLFSRPRPVIDELFDNIPCVTADCDVGRGTPVRVTAGATTRNVDFVMSPGGSISGKTPTILPGFIAIYDSRGVALAGRSPVSFGVGESPYLLAGLPDGIYYVKLLRDPDREVSEQLFGRPDCGGCPVTSGTPVVIRDGARDVTGIDFTANPGRKIRGTIRDATTADPLITITVEILSVSGELIGRGVTDGLGQYAVPALMPGTYYARTSNTRGYADQRYGGTGCAACGVAGSTPIVVTSSADTIAIDFALSRATFVSGVITTATGMNLPNVPVALLATDGRIAARVVSNTGGEFNALVTPGTYVARTEPVAGYRQQLYRNIPCPGGACDAGVGLPIVVGSSAVTGIDFALEACSSLSIAPLRLATAAVESAYRQTLSAAGGSSPFSFSIAAGALPAGLTLDGATGVISGTPTTSGRYTVTIASIDQAGCAGSREYTLDVPACAFTIVDRLSLSAKASSSLITIGGACGDWTPVAGVPWLKIRGVTTSPFQEFAFDYEANPAPALRIGHIVVGPRVVTIYQAGTAAPLPFGTIETPADGAQVSGSVAIGGWALDDQPLLSVTIYRDRVEGEPPGIALIGRATFVRGARPDVEAAYPSLPDSRTAGWGYLLLTNMLPKQGKGTFRIHAYAEDQSRALVWIGSRTIVAVNDTATLPFGAIDTPAQGETISGASYANWGWALTPTPQTIPTDGSTIQVVVDGVPLGTVTYNLFRSDVSTLFPSLNNSAGPVGYRVLDTTRLEEGLHTIAWIVTNDAGQTQGIGSRYFDVRNSAWRTPIISLLSSDEPSSSRTGGVDIGRRAASLDDLPLGDDGVRTVRLSALDRIELDLTPDPSSACAPTYAGYSVVSGEMRDLPVGSTLDPSAGTFYWQPGPAFSGRFELLFVRVSCDGARERIPVHVTITR